MQYELNGLGPDGFQFLVNLIALKEIGPGIVFLGPGPDGGRDGSFRGSANYPSNETKWAGNWHIQSKFHAPHLSKDPQKWLLDRISEELDAYDETDRDWPDAWIVATNIEPSGHPRTGAYDKAMALVRRKRPQLADQFEIWGGGKIQAALAIHESIANHFKHLISPGVVIAELIGRAETERGSVEKLLKHITINQLNEYKHAKLEQAGAREDSRPGIHQIFIDLPYHLEEERRYTMVDLIATGNLAHHFNLPIIKVKGETSR